VTCTEQDKKIANELADQLDLDVGKYGFELKKSKSDISKKTDKELIKSDLKKYSSLNIAIGQLEVVEDIGKRKESLLKEMENMRKEMELDSLLMMITDIFKQDTELLITGKTNLVEKAFKTKVKNNSIYLKGVMSRKKQVSPVLEKVAL